MIIDNVVMWWKNILTKNLGWLKKIMKILKTLLNGLICDNGCNDGAVKVRDSCHITGKYRGSALHNLKNHVSHLIMQELGSFDLKIKVISNGLEKYMSFNINNKLILLIAFSFFKFFIK